MFTAALFAGLVAGDAPKIETKLHGEWKGGACQGVFSFKPDGTYRLTKWSPGNDSLSGTWTMKWDALPPTLVLTCKDSSRKEHIGTDWKLKVSELDGDKLSLAFDSAKEGKATIRYERIKKPADYIKVEVRGKLMIGGGEFRQVDGLANETIQATVHDLPMAFNGNKDLIALAKKLDGKTVIVNGHLGRVAAERIAVQPKHSVSFVSVTELKEAE